MATAYAQVEDFIRQAVIEGQYKPNDRLPTDTELAKRLRVSRLTVHRALRSLAQEGLVRRSPRRGTIVSDPRTNIVGTAALLAPSSLSGWTVEMVTVLSEELLASGLALVPYNAHGTVERAKQLAQLLVRSSVTGVIFIPPTGEDSLEIIEIFRQGNTPVIVEGMFDVPGANVSYVSTNHRQGGEILAEHMLRLGHQRFAVISMAHTQDAVERRDGFCQTVAAAGRDISDNAIFEVRSNSEIQMVVRELFKRKDRPDAIFGISDTVAAEVMFAMHEMGLSIPGDCAVIGMGDDPMSKATLSPMTTARASAEEEGTILAGMFLNTMQGRLTEPQHILLDYELIVRESCGAKRERSKWGE